MRRNLRGRRRAEGYTEYAVILSLIMICSISTFLSAGSRTLRRVAGAKQLCAMQEDGRDCDNKVNRDPNAPENADAVSQEDGSMLHPDGRITHPDGSVEYPDGHVDHPDGGRTNPDGSYTPPAPPPTSWLRNLFGFNTGSLTDDFLLALFGIFSWF